MTVSYAEHALRAGALGNINKDQAADKTIGAIRRVLDGKVYLSDAMVEKMLQLAVGGSQTEVARSPLDALADRELEVFRLIGQGVKTAEVAQQLHLSVKTIETYRDRIRQKLDLSDSTKLAHHATQYNRSTCHSSVGFPLGSGHLRRGKSRLMLRRHRGRRLRLLRNICEHRSDARMALERFAAGLHLNRISVDWGIAFQGGV